tara:strand:- start:30902 stop:32194 length:1293 start_codon:yes stop_codon:yes gene_type:complete
MTKQILGIIGKGEAVRNFLQYTSNKNFSDTISKVVFLNHAYKNESDFLTKGKRPLVNELEFAGIEVHKPISDFREFFQYCNIILDASAGFKPQGLHAYSEMLVYAAMGKKPDEIEHHELESFNDHQKENIKSTLDEYYSKFARSRKEIDLLDYAKFKQRIRKSFLNIAEDHQSYLRKSQFKRTLDFDSFSDDYNLKLDLLEQVDNINFSKPVGMRFVNEFPFSVPMVRKRANKIRQILKDRLQTPMYINLVNEPCLTSNIIVSSVPQMGRKLVACTGYDLSRLERLVRDTYPGIIKYADENTEGIRLRLGGWHDIHVMVPILEPGRGQNRNKFDKFMDGLQDIESVHKLLKKALGLYYNNSTPETRQNQVSEAIYSTIINAADSQDKALTNFPGTASRPLYNGILHPTKDGGLFLIGPHGFRNNRVIPYV